MENIEKIRKIVLAALFTALIAIGAYIAVPLGPVPIILANLFVITAGILLGPVYGTISVLIYLLIGALGIPVFSGGKGGVDVFLGPTSGYLIGYALGAFTAGVISLPALKTGRHIYLFFPAAVAGISIIFIPGLLVLKNNLGLEWSATLNAGLYPFIPGAILKMAVAGSLGLTLHKLVTNSNVSENRNIGDSIECLL